MHKRRTSWPSLNSQSPWFRPYLREIRCQSVACFFLFTTTVLSLVIKRKTRVKVNEVIVFRTHTFIYRYILITWLYAYRLRRYVRTIADGRRMLCNLVRLSVSLWRSCDDAQGESIRIQTYRFRTQSHSINIPKMRNPSEGLKLLGLAWQHHARITEKGRRFGPP